MKRLLTAFLFCAVFLSCFAPSALAAELSAGPVESVEDASSIVPRPWESAPHPSDEIQSNGFASTYTALPFTDVTSSQWFYDEVCFVYENGLMEGTTKTTFSPYRTLTRATVVTILYRAEGEPAVQGSSGFEDVGVNRWFTDAITWAKTTGIVTGTTETKFNPDGAVTREQIAAILYRYCGSYLGQDVSASTNLEGYTDFGSISNFALVPLSWAVATDLMKGVTQDRLAPGGDANRAQVAILMTRLLQEESDSRSSKRLLQFIKSREGFSATPYWDYKQWTIGYGTRCGVDRQGSDVPPAYWDGISEELAEELLRVAIRDDYEPSVERYESRHGMQFTQNQFDALVSFTFNLGAGWTSGGYMLTNWLENPASDLELVWAMGAWCRAGGSILPGLCTRRIAEARMFLYGDYTGENSPAYCYLIFNGNGTLLTTSYEEDIGYYAKGAAYGPLPVPTRKPTVSEDGTTTTYTFEGWFTKSGEQITEKTVVSQNQSVYAKWSQTATRG